MRSRNALAALAVVALAGCQTPVSKPVLAGCDRPPPDCSILVEPPIPGPQSRLGIYTIRHLGPYTPNEWMSQCAGRGFPIVKITRAAQQGPPMVDIFLAPPHASLRGVYSTTYPTLYERADFDGSYIRAHSIGLSAVG